MIKDYFFSKVFKPKVQKVKKCFKDRVHVHFDSKGLDLIKLSSIFNDPAVLETFLRLIMRIHSQQLSTV